LPYNALTYNTLMVIGIVTIPVVIALSYLFFKVYRYQRSITLLGIPVGFLFLTISYVFLGAHLVYPAMDPISSSLMWLRVATQTWGFTLIAASYFMANRTQKITKHRQITIYDVCNHRGSNLQLCSILLNGPVASANPFA
jgi:hypothetical protein